MEKWFLIRDLGRIEIQNKNNGSLGIAISSRNGAFWPKNAELNGHLIVCSLSWAYC